MKKRKIAIITGTRAEFGLLFWVIKSIHEDPDLDLQLLVTGTHLSHEFGYTINEIEGAGFPVKRKIEILLSSDSTVAIGKSMGLGLISFSEVFDELKPDLCLVLGDRFEAFSAVTAAMISRIPIAHCHGGETTGAIIDEPFRHAITKMSSLHFTSTERYRKRVIQLGEHPERVFNVGALGIESISKLELLKKEMVEKRLNLKFNAPSFLVTFHPLSLKKDGTKKEFRELLNALDNFRNSTIVFTYPNADTDGRIIIKMIDDFVKELPSHRKAFKSLGQLLYLSTLQYVDLVIGNSSSGIIEVPSFKKPSINIGERQKNRISGPSVLHTKSKSKDIIKAIEKALSDNFQKTIADKKNPYDNGLSSENILPILKTYNLQDLQFKTFYDL